MSTPVLIGTEIKEIDMLELIPPDEGEINIFYGRIGTGKTYAGTKRIFEELRRGVIVYANWKIKWEGYDERNNKWLLFLGVLGLKKHFFNYPIENFHYMPIKTGFIEELSKLTSCSCHFDEGHIPFDSYEATRMEVEKRSAVFSTRHYDRTMTIYTQRANSVHINLRGNTNRFYKCEKTADFKLFKKRFVHFLVTQFQDLKSGDQVDETRVTKMVEKSDGTREIVEQDEYKFAVSTESYWGRKKIWKNYDSKYLRAGVPESQKNYAQLWHLTWKERWSKLISLDRI